MTPLWSHPSPHLTRLDAFRRHINSLHNVALKDYSELHRWSVDNLELFYAELWDFAGLVTSKRPSRVADSLTRMWPRPSWFPGAELNFTENILATGLAAHPDSVAVSACREAATDWRHLTWIQLRNEVAKYASALRQAGVGIGDRVAVIATNSLEALLIALAAGAVGAIFSSSSPDMGPKGIVDRFSQINPKILFIEPQVLYAGKKRSFRDRLSLAVTGLKVRCSELKTVVSINDPTWIQAGVVPLDQFINVLVKPLNFVQVPFDHPIYILYTSGTTGTPKCICHAGGAALLKHKLDMGLNMDMGIDSTYYQYTTIGWMMWNMLIGALSLGTRIVLYDGNPLHPSPASQLELLESQRVTHWGTGPKFLATLMRDPQSRNIARRLESLQIVLSAGAALSAELASWFYDGTFPKHVGLHNGSGGTDLLGAIVGANNLAPVCGNELAAPVLGMEVEVWDSDGKSVEDSSSERGELVITKPFVSMPVRFWGESGEQRYHDSYFSLFPGVWAQGDFISKNPQTKGYLIHGRSDGVLNPGGIRFGTAELYDAISQVAEIEDSIAVGKRVKRHGSSSKRDKDEEDVLLFVKLRGPAAVLDDALRSKIASEIQTALSPRHVPAGIFQVQDIPYTLNGKRVEKAVKSVVEGDEVKMKDSIANPECLSAFVPFRDSVKARL